MIRFIDLRNQDTGYEFAFWDTVTERFITVGSDQAWDSIADLEEGAMICGLDEDFKQRLIGLCPDWITVQTRQHEHKWLDDHNGWMRCECGAGLPPSIPVDLTQVQIIPMSKHIKVGLMKEITDELPPDGPCQACGGKGCVRCSAADRGQKDD